MPHWALPELETFFCLTPPPLPTQNKRLLMALILFYLKKINLFVAQMKAPKIVVLGGV